jgi:hypothetical protein
MAISSGGACDTGSVNAITPVPLTGTATGATVTCSNVASTTTINLVCCPQTA